ncbi:hypothetical protein ACFLTH_03980 [Bacteroidota bacterium]
MKKLTLYTKVIFFNAVVKALLKISRLFEGLSNKVKECMKKAL